ncbi:hypothetical protein D1BOALGB6SA_9509 [Olavius sp. associated proteobacterium Delta 1]|nr:hypothetical protein D1BOALGB6SA_9509 [Olavius sp. associated proteobacterium Delta 1]
MGNYHAGFLGGNGAVRPLTYPVRSMGGPPVANEEYEIEKLRSEIARNNAERDKLLREADEIHRRARGRLRGTLQAIVGGMVAAGLLSAWGIGYLKPILEKNKELALIENKVLSYKTERQRQSNEQEQQAIRTENEAISQRLRDLEASNASLAEQRADAEELADNLKGQLVSLSKEYSALADQQTGQTDAAEFQRLAEQAQDRVKLLETQIAKLQSGARASENLGVQISTQILSQGLVGTRWKLTKSDGESGSYEFVFRSGGMLESLNPADTTTGNDTWRISRNEVTISMNDGYAIYKGILNEDLIDGSATNEVGKKWNWTAELIGSK